MKKALEVLVVDDDGEFRERAVAAISKAADSARVTGLTSDLVKRELQVLHARQEAARCGKSVSSRGKIALDTADVLFVDFDLMGIAPLGIAHGADVAYFARCYSECGVIILLNRYGDHPFDLTLEWGAKDFRELNHVDLNLGDRQVGNPFLWSSARDGGFAPWSWSDLPSAVARLRRRTRWIEARLHEDAGAPLKQMLGEALPRDMVAALGVPKGASWETWADSAACRRDKDRLAGPHDKARVAAARIGNWLDHVVLPGQDMLVDAPRLASRYPALLRDAASSDDWNSTTDMHAISPLLRARSVRESLFDDWQLWLSRPAWLWAKVRERALDQTWESIPQESLDVVFCEDTSRFLPSKRAKPFISGLRTPFARRYIHGVRGVSYEPQVRLLDGSR